MPGKSYPARSLILPMAAPSSPSPASETVDSFAQMAVQAVNMAADLLKAAQHKETARQRKQAAQIGRMMDDPAGKALTMAMADQIFRPRSLHKSAERFQALINDYGVPKYLSAVDRVLMGLGAKFAPAFASLVMPMVTEQMRRESADVILPAAPEKLHAHLAARGKAGIGMNVNLLGEAILGEEEATHRLDRVVALLADPAITYLSIKLSSVFSQMDVLAFEATVTAVQERLRRLYRAAMANPCEIPGGGKRAKFINLDMEEYRDLHLTAGAFMRTLDEEEFHKLEAGIVLQAYLPDAHAVQQSLTAWAGDRVAHGGAPIKIRLVKGANLAMEQVEASLHGWDQAPYESKLEVDANFKRMVHYALQPEHAAVARVGVASHNLFDIAYTLLLRDHHRVNKLVEIEMLEGMANHQALAVKEAAGDLLLYAPIVQRADFHSAIAYLIRRLDENTSDENFLRDLFGLAPGTSAWETQKQRFLKSCRERNLVASTPNRKQDRSTPEGRAPRCGPDDAFENEPDTDWTSAANRAWINECLRLRREAAPDFIPIVVAGGEVPSTHSANGTDPSRPKSIAYTHALADEGIVGRALQAAKAAAKAWSDRPIADRRALLCKAAAEIARQRGESIATMVMDGGKAVAEGDAEVSEAIDFANYYARAFDDTDMLADVQATPIGTVVVTPPWNFPYAIPCGSVLAALMAGNTVIFKPAPETVLTGWVMINHLWNAGIPKDVLQFVPAPDNHVGRTLIASTLSDAVILTGGYDTARLFQGWKPNLRLHAETSGKNALIITAAADVDMAIKDLVRSAFGHSGQKCSAASLAIVEAEVYDDPAFHRQLKDAAASLAVGGSWTGGAVVTPLIRPPSKELQRAQTTLDEGEEWLLKPRMIDNNPCLWSPGIKLGVKPGSWFHKTECFGPVLGIMRVANLDEAIRVQNSNAFGLTGGIHSLDTREIARWRESVEVGNAYVNRPITGAIVRRQPFGGWKNSVFGPGAKAGGPNYVFSLCYWQQLDIPTVGANLRPEIAGVLQTMKRWLKQDVEKDVAEAAARSFQHYMNIEFGIEHDPSKLHGQTNVFRYRPLPRGILLRLRDPLQPLLLAGAVLAAMTTRVRIELSLQTSSPFADALGIPVTIETEDELARRLDTDAGRYDQLRVPQDTVGEVFLAAAKHHLTVIDQPILANGRIELTHYFREQAISETTHRYGNVPPTLASLRP